MPDGDIVLGLVDAAGEIPSRTMLQKLAYFVAEDSGLPVAFAPYFYGPYSQDLQEDIDALVAAGLLEERARTFEPWQPSPFEGIQYSYELTQDGRAAARSIEPELRATAARVIGAARQANAWNQAALSLAAKLHHLRKVDPEIRDEEVPELARQLGWRIPEPSVRYAARLLALLTQSTTGGR
jgi:uncharacterized protein YwgA